MENSRTHNTQYVVNVACSGEKRNNGGGGGKQLEIIRHASATLGSGNIRDAVKLPQGEDLNEWIAVNSKWESQCMKTTMVW